MQVEDFLTKEEAVRLECVRLAVAAGQPELRADFEAFVTANTQATDVLDAVRSCMQKIEEGRRAKAYGDF